MKYLLIFLALFSSSIALSDDVQGLYYDTATAQFKGLTRANGMIVIGAKGQFPGTQTNDSACPGCVGERVSIVQGMVNFPTTGQYGDLTSISLTPGDWDVSGHCQAQLASATAMAATRCGISTTSGNSATGLVVGDTQIEILPPTSTSNNSGAIPIVRMILTSTTTVYLKYHATYSTASPAAAGRLTARRVR